MDLINLASYLDPSTGSIVLQSIVGIIAGIGVFGRRFFSNLAGKMKGFFSRSGSDDRKD